MKRLLVMLALVSAGCGNDAPTPKACHDCKCEACECTLEGECSCKACDCKHEIKKSRRGGGDGHDNGGGDSCSGGSCG